jgi:hypothetical protein
MRNQRNALVYALVSWFARRWLRQRTAKVTGLAGRASGGHGRVTSVLGAVALVGIVAGAFVAWRKLAGGESSEWETAADVGHEPTPVGEPIPA